MSRDIAIALSLFGAGFVLYSMTSKAGQGVQIDTASGEGDSGTLGGVTDGFLNVGYQVAGLMSTNQISLAGLDFIKGHEGFKATPYKDSAGLWTIGYGHKLSAGEWYDSISDAQATQLLASDLATAEGAVNSLVTVPLKQNQYDALVSFVYNVGAGAFRRSTMLIMINSGNFYGAQAQFPAWRFATVNGVRTMLNGLLARRNDEAVLFGAA